MSKTLFITGASTGIGAATAKAAVAAGWQVTLFARSAGKLETLAHELGNKTLALSGDVTQPESIDKAIGQAVQHFGSLDAVFANAGRGAKEPGVETGNLDDWRGMIDLNIMGVLYTAHASLPALRKTRGTLVLTGSAAGRSHIKGSVYGASKWFVHGLGGNLAEEMRAWGGRCAVIAPGMVDTPFFEHGAPSKIRPEDVAKAVLHMLDAPSNVAIRETYLMPQALD